MPRRVRVSAVSSDFIILDPAEGDERGAKKVRAYLEGLIAPVLPDRPDLIVLPEVCDRPDNYEMPRRGEYFDHAGPVIMDLMRKTARDNGTWIVYPTERQDDSGVWRNAAWLIDRRGEISGVYDKIFVTISQMGEAGFACGTDVPLMTTEIGRVGMAICFDLNFPDIRASYEKSRPDLVIFPSHYHGSFVAQYWAYAARAWLVGAIARHECYLVSPTGTVAARSGPGRRFLSASINLDRCVVHCEWEDLGKLEDLKKKHGDDVGVNEAGFGGNYLVTSETDGLSAETMVREAGLVSLDDYLRAGAGAAWRGA